MDKRDAMIADTSPVPSVVINPGTGEVRGATEDHATTNIQHFIADLQPDDGRRLCVEWSRAPGFDYGKGRYAFVLRTCNGTRFSEIQMPGWPLSEVRFTPDLDPWVFPRLYVNGSSWLWAYAIGCAHDDLFGERDE